MERSMLAWLPYASVQEAGNRLGGLPDKVTVDCYPGHGAPMPESIAEVEFYVLPYLGGGSLQRVAEMSSLQVVQTQTAGYEDVAQQIPDGVRLCNAAGLHDTSTAEMALALMLAIGRHLDDAARNQTAGTWKGQWGDSIADKHVLIVGYGRIGAAIERRLAGFEVGGVTRVARRARPGVHPIDDLDDLLPTADVVVLVMPLTDQTQGMFDARRLALLPDSALLVNVGRGGLVDTDALVAQTRTGRIRAAMDVVDPEPLPSDHPLWHCPGVLISPHVGGASSAFGPRADALIADQLGRWARAEPLINQVN